MSVATVAVQKLQVVRTQQHVTNDSTAGCDDGSCLEN